MEVRRLDDPVAFLEAAGPLLLADEPRHNLLLGLAATLRDQPSTYPEYALWLAEEAGRTVGAALRTLPHRLVLARPLEERALEALAGALEGDLPGVVGGVPEAGTFAAAWSARTGLRARLTRRQGIYALEQVLPLAPAPGRLRAATPGDRPLLIDWFRAFAREAHGEEAIELAHPEAVARAVDNRLADANAGLVLWENGDAVSFAGFGGQTPNGIRIGPVYTPPAKRRRGYASSLVAELSRRLLASRRFCFLYTDLANPTANKIYRQLGYEWVCQSAELAFQPV
ncbi:MAG TPA: GNAT family N-acetyltransferase [Gaiellaceae bacterium]